MEIIKQNKESLLVHKVYNHPMNDQKYDKKLAKAISIFEKLKSSKSPPMMSEDLLQINKDVKEWEKVSYKKYSELSEALLMLEKLGEDIVEDCKNDEEREDIIADLREVFEAKISDFT
jgi:seryl-tRNA synthetase